MIKIFCDKCGKEIEEYEAYTLHVHGPEIVDWDDRYPNEKDYQICKDCMKEVDDFITVSTGTVVSRVLDPLATKRG